MTETRSWTRCIVLLPSGCAVGAKVRRLAAARDWVAVEQHDPYLAMAEICIRRRAQRSRRSWGLPSAERLALVIVERRHWRDLDALLGAVGQFAPDVSVWTFTSDDLSPLRSSSTVAPPPDDDGDPVELPSSRPPVLRLADADARAASPEAPRPAPAPFDDALAGDDGDEDSTVRISPEEIEMLLAAPGPDEEGA